MEFTMSYDYKSWDIFKDQLALNHKYTVAPKNIISRGLYNVTMLKDIHLLSAIIWSNAADVIRMPRTLENELE